MVFQDNMQGYAVGAEMPLGSLIGSAVIANDPLPDGLIGPYGESKYLKVGGASASFYDSNFRYSGSIWCAFCIPYPAALYGFSIATQSGVYPGGYPSCTLRVNRDGTISLADAHNVTFATSTFSLKLNVWYFLQLNISFTIDGGGHYVIQYSVNIDGKLVIPFGTWATGIGLATPWLSTAWIAGNTTYLTNLAIDSPLDSPGTVPTPGSPIVRITNQVIEIIGKPPTVSGNGSRVWEA